MVRIGLPPKRAVLLRTDEPFEKLSRAYTAPDGSQHKIEILCAGQQIIVDGIHPDTHQPYAWHGGSPLTVSRNELPHVRKVDVERFLDKATTLLVDEYGFQLSGKKANGKDGEPRDAGGRADWPTLKRNILDGVDLHDSARDLTAAYIACGMSRSGAEREVEALFLTSDAPRDERWQARFEDIGRAARSAEEKFRRHDETTGENQEIKSRDLKAMQFEPIKYVVHGVIVEGLTLFAGKPKIGKSWLLLHVAIAVARRGFTLGAIHCEEGDVLYCALEDNLRRLKSRMSKLLGMDADWPERLTFKTAMPRLAEGGIDAIREWLKRVPSPRLVIIDTLAMVRAPRRRDESTYDLDYSAVKELRTLAAEYGVAIVIVHHLRKAEADDAFDTISGTLGLTGAPDTILVIRRDSSGAIVMHGRGRDLVDFEKAMTFNKDACTWTITGNASDARMSAERHAILEALKNGAGTPADIADTAGLKRGSVRHLVLKMAREGTLKKTADGKYEAAGL